MVTVLLKSIPSFLQDEHSKVRLVPRPFNWQLLYHKLSHLHKQVQCCMHCRLILAYGNCSIKKEMCIRQIFCSVSYIQSAWQGLDHIGLYLPELNFKSLLSEVVIAIQLQPLSSCISFHINSVRTFCCVESSASLSANDDNISPAPHCKKSEAFSAQFVR